MASSDQTPGVMPGEGATAGKPMTVGSQILDKGAQMLQSMKPVKQMKQHVCTFAMYSHDMTRQIETHHYVTRLNQDFLQCAVYDSDDSSARLIGVEYIISDRIFENLPHDEQKLWHSHAYEIKSGLWLNPRVPEMLQKTELQNLAKTYGKFWCTWQVDRGNFSLISRGNGVKIVLSETVRCSENLTVGCMIGPSTSPHHLPEQTQGGHMIPLSFET